MSTEEISLISKELENENKITNTLKHPFEWIPTCLYLIIRDYLARGEFLNLLNSSLSLFHAIKREINSWNFSFKTSIKYCRDESFRNYIQKQVNNVKKQISLDLYSQYHKNLSKYYYFGCKDGLYKLMIRDIDNDRDLSCLADIEELCIQSFDQLKSLKGLKNTLKLKIYDCDKLLNISSLATTCRELQSVTLSNCSQIKSAKGLEHVPIISLEYLRNLKDIRMLGTQKKLTLKGLNKVTDISHLGNVTELE